MDDDQLTLDGFDAEDGAAIASLTSLASRTLPVKELTRWCRHISTLIARRTGADYQSDAFLFAQAVKLGEEVGELQAEILGWAGQQRADKSGAFTAESLASELADVAICVGILAEITGVDLSRALVEKMERINHRSGQRSHSGARVASTLGGGERFARSR